MTAAERAAVDRARMVARLRKAQTRGRPMTVAERVAKHTAAHSVVERRPCADPKRRARLERDPAKWLAWYLAAAYTRRFDAPHLSIIKGAMRAHETGGRFAVAAERGVGKSALLYGIILYLALTGRRRFPVYLPWSARAMKRGLQFWRAALAFNERLLADYPEYCAPFAHGKGVAQRMPAMRWSDTGEACGALLQICDGMIVLPDARGVIGGSSVNGNPRGLNLSQSDGSIIRPDLALVDDPQDRDVASSLAMVTETCAVIDSDIAGLGSAGSAFPILLSGNCIVEDDVMARYLCDPGWSGIRVSCVERWPDGWADNGPVWKLWRDWWELYRDDPAAGAAHYRKHRSAMRGGMELSAPNAYRAMATRTLPDMYCVAMRQYWQMGHAPFMAEKQQRPQSEVKADAIPLTVRMICSRAETGRQPHTWPAGVPIVNSLVSTDINDYGLSTVCLGFANDQTAAVPWYGLLDNGGAPIMLPHVPEAEKARQLFDALVRAGEILAALPERPQTWGIDAGYMGPVVRRYADTAGRRIGMRIILCRGMDAQRYRPGFRAIGQPREQCHMTEWPQIGRGLSWCADYWREVMQRAWLGEIGRPGACSLFEGDHREFAEQIYRERFLGKDVVGGKTVYVFARQPGRHDFGDAMAQGYALAAFEGVGTGGTVTHEKKRVGVYIARPSQRR